VADGNVFGRGSLDDKGMGIMELMTMLLLKRQNANLSRDVIMLATCDEEIGSPMGARWMVENHFADLDREYVLDEGGEGRRGFYSADDAFEIVVDEKRMVRIRLVARSRSRQLFVSAVPTLAISVHGASRHTGWYQACSPRTT
jgi:acetylornithine deacetylase/succinyl-diaminopimelate desuccinylase-like protein